jgi:hypothetical protein
MFTLPSNRITGLLALAAVMLITRLFHFNFPPDASWAVFFLSGFYRLRIRAFALLLLEAVVIDYVATAHMGISGYCLSVSYLFVPPAYAALWLGGRWAANHGNAVTWRRIAALAVGAVASISVCFLLTNSSFYWLSGRHTHPDMAGWAAGFARWYPYFLAVSCVYVGLAVSIQLLSARLAPGQSGTGRDLPQH